MESPLLKYLLVLRDLSPPKFVYHSFYSKRMDFASNVLYGIALINFLTTTWPLRFVSSFKNMDVAANGPLTLYNIAPRAPLYRTFGKIIPGWGVHCQPIFSQVESLSSS